MSKAPFWPRALALIAATPLLAASTVVVVGPGDWRAAAQGSALIQAALLLVFAGGGWWGIAAGAPAAERRGSLAWLWLAGFAMVGVALAACALPWLLDSFSTEPSLIMLAAALLLSAGVDARLGGLAPEWWRALRIPLALVTGFATAAAALA